MRKSFIVLLATVGGLASLVIGIAAARSARSMAAKLAHATHGAAAPAHPEDQNGSPGGSPGQRVIRFASNPLPLPPFLVNDLEEKAVSTAAWHGKVVLINFWATWCPPCRDEIPELVELQNRYKDRLQIVGISMDDSPPAEVKQFAKEIGINYPVVMYSREIVSEFGGVPALPTSFVVNQDGRVVQKHVGFFPIYVYEAEVRALLGLPVDAKIETFQDTGQIFLKNAALATELPGVSFAGLTPEQKKAALKRLNSEICDCGCKLTIAQCRINDTSCPISKSLAEKVIKQILSGSPVSSPSTANR